LFAWLFTYTIIAENVYSYIDSYAGDAITAVWVASALPDRGALVGA
jgi:hypothetical protein